MEGERTTEPEIDEFEMLLGEIPATLGNANDEHPIPDEILSVLQTNSIGEKNKLTSPPSSKFIDLYNYDMSYDQKLDSLNNGYDARALNGERDQPNLRDDKSLVYAFEELSFKNRILPKPTNPLLENYDQTSPVQCSFNNSRTLFGLDSLEMPLPSLHQPVTGNYTGYNDLELKKKKPEIISKDLGGHQQRFPVYNGAMPLLNPRLQAYQQQFLLEEERYPRLEQQHLHQQQLHNHIHGVQNMNSAINPLIESGIQSYYEIPRDPKSYWNKDVTHRGYTQFDVSAMGGGLHQYHLQSSFGRVEGCNFPHRSQLYSGSGEDFSQQEVLLKVGKQYSPEKILTRSHGVNSLRDLRSYSTINQLTPNSMSVQVKFNSLDEVTGRIYSLSKDQHGCRFLQNKFTEGSLEDINKIFLEIIGHIVELMTDPFGNYLVQKLLGVCNEDQRMQIIDAITTEAGLLIKISCNMHGTRAVQKVIETLKTTEQVCTVVSSLKPGIVSLVKDVNGNHVAQRCLQYFSPQQTEFLLDAVVSHCVEIATDRQGCCVLQKCVHYSYGDQRKRLISEITSYSLVLSQDPYGNYVVQYVLDQKVPWVITAVVDQLEGNFGFLSIQKHSSNVVEKCLNLAKEEDRIKIIKELMNSPLFLQILQDAYGNYVIQSALKLCKVYL
ncbi:pumilio homolog 12-like isoform X2 [Asparagus officinalis]|uniref:pumilio homolog 12-like isoform X2 n=1 Tax=Asparagus officinalis TaxID=4686 RepID=UPI00098DF971|nr:pumilio homolog 12-like isoform X2 [Asparagus officinalis]